MCGAVGMALSAMIGVRTGSLQSYHLDDKVRMKRNYVVPHGIISIVEHCRYKHYLRNVLKTFCYANLKIMATLDIRKNMCYRLSYCETDSMRYSKPKNYPERDNKSEGNAVENVLY